MREAIGERAVESHLIEQVEHTRLALGLRAAPVDGERLADGAGDRHARIERGTCILRNQLDLRRAVPQLTPREVATRDAVDHYLAGLGRLEPHRDARERRLAAARLTDERNRLSLAHRHRHAAQRVQALATEGRAGRTVRPCHIAELEQRTRHGPPPTRG